MQCNRKEIEVPQGHKHQIFCLFEWQVEEFKAIIPIFKQNVGKS